MKSSKKSSAAVSAPSAALKIAPAPAAVETPAPAAPSAPTVAVVTEKRDPLAVRFQKRLTACIERLESLSRQSAGWTPELDASLPAALAAGRTAEVAAKALPRNFRRPDRTTALIVPGAVVNVTAAGAKSVGDALEATDLIGLTVIRVSGKNAVVKAPSGIQMMLPTSYLVPAAV